MKKCLFLTVALTLSVFSLFTTSCDNNDEPNVSKPVATLAEVGEENSKTATAGSTRRVLPMPNAARRAKTCILKAILKPKGSSPASTLL